VTSAHNFNARRHFVPDFFGHYPPDSDQAEGAANGSTITTEGRFAARAPGEEGESSKCVGFAGPNSLILENRHPHHDGCALAGHPRKFNLAAKDCNSLAHAQ
jgi:hypothetical protein